MALPVYADDDAGQLSRSFTQPPSSSASSATPPSGVGLEPLSIPAPSDSFDSEAASERGLVAFEASGRADLRATSFLLLCRELAAAPHVGHLRSVNLSSNPHLAGTLRCFAPLENLRKLNCAFCPKLRGPLAELFAPPPSPSSSPSSPPPPKGGRGPLSLTHLQLGGTSVGGDLSPCGRLLALRVLDLTRTKVGGDLACLAELASLQALHLAGLPRVRGHLFPALQRLRRLTDLDLQRTAVGASAAGRASAGKGSATGSALDGCEAWEKLQRLNLSSCASLKGSIASLAACPRLVDLNVRAITQTKNKNSCLIILVFLFYLLFSIFISLSCSLCLKFFGAPLVRFAFAASFSGEFHVSARRPRPRPVGAADAPAGFQSHQLPEPVRTLRARKQTRRPQRRRTPGGVGRGGASRHSQHTRTAAHLCRLGAPLLGAFEAHCAALATPLATRRTGPRTPPSSSSSLLVSLVPFL
jgi:hypothetical protein